MPALYDDIGDAFEPVADDTAHTFSLDNTGATCQTNEATFGECQFNPFAETVWVAIDLSTQDPGVNIDLDVDLIRTGGDPAFAPEFACFRVTDASFDPTSPDFSKLAYVNAANAVSAYYGDGTTNPAAGFLRFEGGVGDGTGVSSATGIFYLAFNDYNYATYGSATATLTVPPAFVCLDAVDLINPDSTTASIVSGRVREDNDDVDDLSYTPDNLVSTLKWTWTGDSGLYLVKAIGQMATTGNSGLVEVALKIRGVTITCYDNDTNSPGTTAEFSWIQYHWTAGYDVGDYVTPGDRAQYPYVYISSGDTVEVTVISYVHSTTTPFPWIPFEIRQICFAPLELTVPGTCTGRFRFPEDPLGDAWGSLNGWGGQKLIPDEIWTDLGVTPYNEADSPWGVNYTQFDFQPLADGTVYCIFQDGYNTGTGTPTKPTNTKFYVVIKKYDPGSNTWSQLDTININPPTDKFPASYPSCAYDGTYVYFAWWEVTTYTPGGTPTYQSDWHMLRLDPTDDSTMELGTGQHSVTVSASNQDNAELLAVPPGIAPVIVCEGNGGDLWVAVFELTRADAQNWRRPYIWRWNGAAWTDLALPAPTHVGSLEPEHWELAGLNSDYDKPFGMALADKDGINNSVLTVYYPYIYENDSTVFKDSGETIQYTIGSGWGGEFSTDWVSVETSTRLGTTSGPESVNLLNPDVLWSNKLGKLTLTGDIGGGSDEPWDVFQLNDAGNQWEIVNDWAPGNVAMDSRASRNTSAIGPDNNIYRGMIGEGQISDKFQPRLAKHDPNYLVGYSNAAHRACGETASWMQFMYNTCHVPIRIIGEEAWVLYNLSTESMFFEAGDERFADGFFMFKCAYVPCGGVIPLFRPRVFSVSNV